MTALAGHLLIFTGNRADWGLLSRVAEMVRQTCGVTVVATNMHLSHEHGDTLEEIRRDGYKPFILPWDTSVTTDAGRVEQMGQCQAAAAKLIDMLHPTAALILGDRFEMLACATACLMMRVPIFHMAGGAVSYGAVDDSIRHAITKMATYHLTETERYRQRVISMGENPERVFNVGAIGAELPPYTLLPRKTLSEMVGMELDRQTLLLTYHPATLDTVPISERLDALEDAVTAMMQVHKERRLLVTASNNDAGGEEVNRRMRAMVEKWPGRAVFVPSLGHANYIAVLHAVGAVAGNSSSGLVEVPSAGIPTVDIGNRQLGRDAGPSVIHCDNSAPSILAGLEKAFMAPPRNFFNPYHKEGTAQNIACIIGRYIDKPLPVKMFYEAACNNPGPGRE